MSVRIKLLVIVLFAALVPLAVSAYTALGVHRSAFDAAVEQQQRDAAYFAAVIAEERLEHVRRSLRSLASPIRWADLTEQERSGALSLVYAQLDDIAVVQLLDADGEGIGRGIYLTERSSDPDLAAHPVVSLETLKEFSERIPFDHTNKDAVLVGAVFAAEDGDTPLVGLSVRVTGAEDAHWYVAVGMSLASLCDGVRGAPSAALTISVVDDSGRVICPEPGGELLAPAAPEVAGATSGEVSLVSFEAPDGIALRGAVAPMPTGWAVVAQQPASTATAASRKMVKQTIFWIAISVAVALAAGLFLAQGIIAPVRKLTAGADELARGNLSYRLDVAGKDELAELARTFNHMSSEVEARNEEIKGWNVELQDRVDERTRELKKAQQQLLQSQKIAAVSSLAAGVAHEINNPLTGVLGLTQVLKLQAGTSDPKKLEMLTTIETEAKRIRDIVQTLLTFSQESGGEGWVELEVKELAEGAAGLIRSKFEQAGVELVLEHAEGVPPVRGNDAQLRQALLHLLSNALGATDRDGVVTVQTRSVEGKVAKLVVVDTGRGIAPENLDRIFEPFFTTKEDWSGQGLGLTVAYRVVEEHGGSIEVRSELGKGTTVEVTLPALAGGAHLV